MTNYGWHTFDALDHLHTPNTPDLNYDANGNTTGYGALAYFYDAQDHLIKRSGSGPDVSITYDADGNRIKKVVGSTVTTYLVDDLNPTGYAQVVEEHDASGSPTVVYVYGLDLISQKRGGTLSYYGYDSHGSVRYLTSSSGAISDTCTYDSFGIQIAHTGVNTPNSYRYTGEQWDQDLGMYYLRARYYQPQTGRFWTMDTFEGNNEDPLSLHKYLYATDNPVNNIDPSGNETLIGVSVASTIGNSLHSMYDGGVLTVQQAMQHTIFGVQAGKSTGDVLAGYSKEVAIGIGIGVVAGKLLSKLDDVMYGGGFFRGKPRMCFVGDTEVAAETGLKRIDEICEGDYVWSWNENTRSTNLGGH